MLAGRTSLAVYHHSTSGSLHQRITPPADHSTGADLPRAATGPVLTAACISAAAEDQLQKAAAARRCTCTWRRGALSFMPCVARADARRCLTAVHSVVGTSSAWIASLTGPYRAIESPRGALRPPEPARTRRALPAATYDQEAMPAAVPRPRATKKQCRCRAPPRATKKQCGCRAPPPRATDVPPWSLLATPRSGCHSIQRRWWRLRPSSGGRFTPRVGLERRVQPRTL